MLIRLSCKFSQLRPIYCNRWKKITDKQCVLCKRDIPQTNKHVLSNCPAPAALLRYTSRHNDVLQLLIIWLKSVISNSQEIFADINDDKIKSTCELFHTFRPDIAIVNHSSVVVFELTVCHETNLDNSKQYKLNKYRDLGNCGTPRIAGKTVACHSIEVSTLGFISSCVGFTEANKLPRLPMEVKQKIIRSVLNNSFKIYCSRNSI